ncbi:MAG: DUF935 family protein [Microscillaceae bacterium]|nr:DUF935 family protein [Microscillaceae bacterium]
MKDNTFSYRYVLEKLASLGGFKKPNKLAGKNIISPLGKAEKQPLINIVKRQKWLYTVDIEHWRFAQEESLDVFRPRRITLQEVYFDCLLDAHMRAVMQSRVLNVLNTPWHIVNEDRERDEQLTRLLKKKWFFKFLRYAMESVFHGYSFIHLDVRQGLIQDVLLIERENCVPDFFSILPDVNGDEMISISLPPYSDLYLMIGSSELGILLECAPYAIFKKNGIRLWSQFQELFGIPYRVGKYRGTDKNVMDRMEQHLREMGSAGWGLFPQGAEIEFIETSKGDAYNVFLSGIEFADKQISKRVLGQTMTTENGSSLSQSEVHERKEGNITTADLRMVEFEINDNLFAKLIKWGVPLQGYSFEFNLSSKLPLALNQLSIDQWLIQHFDIDGSYIEKTYGTPVKAKALPSQAQEPEEEEEEEEGETEENKKPNQQNQKADFDFTSVYAEDTSLLANFLKLAKKVFKGDLKKGDIDDTLFKFYQEEFTKSIEDGFESTLKKLKKGSKERALMEKLLTDAQRFSAHKTYQMIGKLSDLKAGFKDDEEDLFNFSAQVVHNNYNVSYMNTERNNAIAITQNARNFLQYQDEKDEFPYLRFQAVGDDRTRAKHKSLSGITLPIDHEFWEKYLPPIDHNCRCEAIQVGKLANPTPDERLKDLPKPDKAFQNNAAKTGQIYTDDHAYYKGISEEDQKKITKFLKDVS